MRAFFDLDSVGLLLTSQAVLPDMIAAKSGVILATSATAAVRGSARLASLAMGKHATRALAQSIAREHAANGIHVCNVRIDCGVDGPRAKQFMGERSVGRFDETGRCSDAALIHQVQSSSAR